MASFAKWVLTGVAAILGLLIANADSVTNIISEGCFRWGMILMALSLIPSVVSINTSIAIEMTMATMESLYTRFFSPEGLSDLLAMKAEPEEVMEEIIKPFPEFLKPWLRRRKVQTDSLAMERRCLRLLQIQMASGLCFYALSVLGMVILVVGI